MLKREIIIGITTVFAWVPALILSLLSIFVLLMGFIALLDANYILALSSLAVSTGGLLGFAALTSLSWGLYITFFKRLTFLVTGVISLSVVLFETGYVSTQPISINNHPLVIYLFYSPLVIGIFHIALHCAFWLRLPNKTL